MTRKILLLSAIVFLFMAIAPAFSQTEDDVVAQYLKKTEKKQKAKSLRIGFVSLYGAYGKLPNDSPYNKFRSYANSNITALNGSQYLLTGIWRSKQLGVDFGMMITSRIAAKVGFEYWLKMGSNKTSNYDFDAAFDSIGVKDNFNLVSEINIYGVNLGVDYYLLNPPDKKGMMNSIAVRITANGGYYFSKWNIWQGSKSFINSATGYKDVSTESLKGSSVGVSGSIGLDYPIRFWGLVAGVDAGYLYLNMNNIHAHNNLGEELYLTCSNDANDRVDLDFSGLRAKIELKKLFCW
ncbi:MAG: hypothetical protein NTV06_04295 [candidate division Zixibacteria bacterium]|nr:hypothetical protein [candidate division Zixibacteria bacterium]